MSKISNIHLELTEQANELGFESIEQAEANGYKVDYTGEGWVLKPDTNKAYEEKHEAWLKERDNVIKSLTSLRERAIAQKDTEDALIIGNAILFIKEQCHD